jgi:hypothetical protein
LPVFAGVVGGLFCSGPCCALVRGARNAGVTGFYGAWPVILQKARQRGRLRPACGCWLFKGQLVAAGGGEKKAGLEVCFYIVAYIL